MRLVITICATKSYTYALIAQARRVVAMILRCREKWEGCIVLVGDDSEPLMEAEQHYQRILPSGWETKRIIGTFADGEENYKTKAQLIIARMRSAAFDEARRQNPDLCLSMDSDVLPHALALVCMLQGLAFAEGHYSVSTCPYPSQGGGDFLAGRGTQQRPILQDVNIEERMISEELRERMERLKECYGPSPLRQPATTCMIIPQSEFEEEKAISKAIEESPAKGDVFFLNSRTGVFPFVESLKDVVDDATFTKIKTEAEAKWPATGWRKRGWMSAAYPALGIGAILPTDWCGFGCTLMSPKALALAQFDGYDGGGTEDLYVVWKRWHRAGLRINTIPHCPADHVIRNPDKEAGGYILCQAFHELDGECEGHLRIEKRPWYQQTEGEGAPIVSSKTRGLPAEAH